MPVISRPRGVTSSGSGGRGTSSTSATTTTTSTTVIVNDLNDDISVTSASFTLLRDNEPLPPEHQELNVKALQRKLMELKAEKEGVPLFTKTRKYNNNNNNNNRITRSQNNISDPKKKSNVAGEKVLSKSVNNLSASLVSNNAGHKGYHRNCYTSAGPADYSYFHLYGTMAAAAVAKHNNYRNNLQNGAAGAQNESPKLARKKRSSPGEEGTPPQQPGGRGRAAPAGQGRERPMFVTTVKSGCFLEPPPELAALLGLPRAGGLDQRQVLLYSFSSQPRVLPSNAGRQQVHKARCPAAALAAQKQQQLQQKNGDAKKQDAGPPYANIMYDRRVVRGSTFAQHPIPTDGESQAARQAEVRRRALARKRAHAQQGRLGLRIGSPPPVAGRKHETVQTSAYLEEILDRPLEEDACCQTDLFLDRPPTPPYVPAKTGLDEETQIYPGDLFDFDLEVEPILEVLVGKTIEQAMIEVLSEEEMAAMRAQQRRLEERRAGEEAEIKRLEERERRMREEKDRRVSQLERELREQQEAEERLAAALLTRGYLEDALPAVLRGLNEAGYFIDAIREDVLQNFMPWLMNEVRQEMDQMVASRQVLTDLVRDIVRSRRDIYMALVESDRHQRWLEGHEHEQEFQRQHADRLKKELELAEVEAAKAEEAVDEEESGASS
ncbi:radial spoke head protein 3 homolog [Schistocerca nitens]|uniref:radial spoke head protein 3 homolog n=1 Tax=Schistocerca nitens TaxID=7011 RepID=UPI0021191A6E|nr:radial spoke head protein 3 homolog [Schistocerca nitens]